VFMRKLFDAILQVTQNWAEVTGSSPTPAALQPYASTVPDTADNSNSNPSTGQRCVAYLTTDPEVASSGKAVSFALYIYNPGSNAFMTLLVNDYVTYAPSSFPVTGDISDQKDLIPNNAGIMPFNHRIAVPLHGGATNLYTSSSSTATSQYDVYVYVFEDDNMLSVLLYSPTYDAQIGAVYLFWNFNDVNAPRTEFPRIGGLAFGPGNSNSYTGLAHISLQGINHPGFNLVDHGAWTAAGVRTRNGEVLLSGLHAVYNNGWFVNYGRLQRLYSTHANEVKLLHNITYGGKTFVCIGKTNYRAYLLDITDLNP